MTDLGQSWDNEVVTEYVCETCGRTEQLTQQQAYQAGWDYPPFIGSWGVVSPRTCGSCLIDTTAYWTLITQGAAAVEADERHMATIRRIVTEQPPGSIPYAGPGQAYQLDTRKLSDDG